MGGLSKKAYQFNTIASTAAIPHLTLDAGSLLFKHAAINPAQEKQEKLTATAIVEAYNLIGYQAVCVGNQDLAAGLPFLQSLRDKAKFTWLSANLVSKSTKKTLFQASTTLKVGAIKAGVIGLTGPAILPAAEAATILPWEEVLPELLAKMSKRHDLLILLSNLPAADNQRIAETYPAVHLLLQSGAAANSVSAGPVNNTVIASTGPQGKQAGVMDINWQPGKRWGDQKSETLKVKQAALDRLLFELSKFQQDKDPEIALRNQPDQLQTYHILLGQEKELRGDIEQLSQAIAKQNPANSKPSSFSNRFLAMETNLPDQPEVERLISQLETDIYLLGKAQAKSVALADSPYVGFQACGQCHAAQLSAWRQSRHANAYLTLEKDKQQFNPSCLPCHVTGVAMEQGTQALGLTEARRGVGCETCHGPGRRHGESPKDNTLSRRPGPEVCTTCHRPPHDPAFRYEDKIKMVGH